MIDLLGLLPYSINKLVHKEINTLMKKFSVFLSPILIFAALIMTNQSLLAQQDYPKEVLPGKSIKVGSKAQQDTLWVINHDQMMLSVDEHLRLKKADSLFTIFQAEILTFQRVIKQKNEIISRLSKDKKDLKAKLETCETEAEANSGKKKKGKKKKK